LGKGRDANPIASSGISHQQIHLKTVHLKERICGVKAQARAMCALVLGTNRLLGSSWEMELWNRRRCYGRKMVTVSVSKEGK